MFKNEYDYLIHLIYCAIHNLQPNEKPKKVSFVKVFEAAKAHETAAITFVSIDKLQFKPDDELYKKWKAQYGFSIQRHANQMLAQGTILKALGENGVRSIQLQGAPVKKLYPYEFWRNMSDLDFVVDKQNLSRIEKIMQHMGYTTKHHGECEIDAYGPKKIAVEFHTDFCSPDSEFCGVITDPFKNAKHCEDGRVFVADETDLFLHNVFHTIKHHRIYGAGIRRILDIYFLNQKILPRIDKERAEQILEISGCKEDYCILSKIASEWFETGAKKGEYDHIKNKIFMSDTHGSLLVTIVNEHQKSDSKKQYKVKKALSLAFPTKEQIYCSHPFCKKHKLPIVVCWVYRFFYLLVNGKKRRYALEILKTINKL